MLKTVITMIVSGAIPLFFNYLFKGSGPVIPVTCFALLFPLIVKISKKKFLPSALIFTAALYCFGSLIITPYSLIEAWLDSVWMGEAQGGISSLFTALITLFTTLFLSLFIKTGKKNLFYLLLSGLFFAGLLTRIPWFFISMAILFLIYGLFPALEKGHIKNYPLFTLLIIIASLMALLFGTIDDTRGSDSVNRLSGNLRLFILNNFPSFPLENGIPGYGYGFRKEKKEMGRTPILTPKVLFEVTARPREVLYLRSEISLFPWGEEINETEESESHGAPGYRDSFTIKVKDDFFNSYIHPLDTLKIKNREKEIITSSSGNKTLYPEKILKKEDQYKIFRGKEPVKELKDREIYLSLPPALSEDIIELSKDFAADNKLITLKKIRNYLKENFIYTLETEGRSDYIENFLFETKEGYCMHFASSLLLLARLNDIPARFVTGFLTRVPEATDPGRMRQDVTYRVTGETSHAWVEVWVEKLGWMTWEVTPPMEDTFLANRDYDILDSVDFSKVINQKITTENEEEKSFTGLIIPLISAGSFLIVLLLIFIRIKRRRRSFEKIKRVLVKRGLRLGVLPPGKCGWVMWTESLKEKKPHLSETLESCRDTLLKGCYSSEGVGGEDLENLNGLIKKLKSPVNSN